MIHAAFSGASSEALDLFRLECLRRQTAIRFDAAGRMEAYPPSTVLNISP